MNHYVIFFTFSIHKIIIVSGYKKIVKINIFKKVSLKGLTDMLTYSFADIGSDSLYEHLYKCIKNDIKKGVLEKNEKLPSKRRMHMPSCLPRDIYIRLPKRLLCF